MEALLSPIHTLKATTSLSSAIRSAPIARAYQARTAMTHSLPTPPPSALPPRSQGWAKSEVTAAVSGEANVKLFQKIQRDFRSESRIRTKLMPGDTLTMQSDAMMLATLKATRGDDVYGEDETTRALEERCAKMSGKEAALFAPSGTMTNQLAIRAHLKQPPHSVLLDYRAHVHKMEAGGIAMFSQATTHQLFPRNQLHLTAVEVEKALSLGDNIHTAPTKLICLENTMSGMIFPQDEVVKIGQLANKHDITIHCDGARMWNVAAQVIEERGLDATSEADRTEILRELLEPFDSASLCLSKGIGAPLGSVLVGSKEMIERARWFRKMFGGGVRQVGMASAAADFALTNIFPRLAGTHTLAKRLGEGLKEAGCEIIAPVQTNMVFFDPAPIGFTAADVHARLLELSNPIAGGMGERIVIHHQINPEAVEDFIQVVREMRDEKGVQVAPEQGDPWAEEGELRKEMALGY